MIKIQQLCKVHGMSEHYITKDNHKRCNKCNVIRVSKRRRAVKQLLVDHFGGKCIKCGYNKSIKALQFHHRDPNEKDFGLASGGKTMSFNKLLAEASKCDLVCANCHAELHEAEEILK